MNTIRCFKIKKILGPKTEEYNTKNVMYVSNLGTYSQIFATILAVISVGTTISVLEFRTKENASFLVSVRDVSFQSSTA